MAFRGNESPMDFEWQGYGPIDPTSPFHRHAMQNAKKRTHTQFDSPKKSAYPQLQEPNGKPWFFSSPPKATEPPSYRTPSFTTPRKAIDIDFSSGPESSPAGHMDNEDTPDGKPLPPLPYEFSSKPSTKRNSLFNMYGKFAPSPGRGEIKKPASDALAKRIHKKRRQAKSFEKQLALARREDRDSSDDNDDADDDDDDDDAEPVASPRKPKSRPKPVHEVGWMTSLFTFIHTYPDAPSIIAKYLQVFFNAAILGSCLYMFWSFWITIRADVDRASDEAMAEVLSEMAACSKNYVDNRCGADNRLPALETVCSNWELCMNRDPSSVKRARLSAHTFAEIFNSFVEPISLKTMIFTTLLVVLALLVNNATFTIYRRSQEQQDVFRHPSGPFAYPGQPAAAHAPYPATPSVHNNHQAHLAWHPTGDEFGQPDQLDYQRSPSKEKRARTRSPEKKMIA